MKEKFIKYSKFLVLLLIVPLMFCFTACGNKTTKSGHDYSIEYTSIEDNSTYFYLVVNVISRFVEEDSHVILSNDFAVKKNGLPICADGITKFNSNIIHSNIVISGLQSVSIYFKCPIKEIDNPATFYYQGKELKLGEKLYIDL